jgi:TetR/AcrR family transcriptional regulator, regulator of cefoperazone and chloramphenicol sensitivity
MGTDTDRQHDTRERLLEAAGEVFAQRGYRAATVREISRLAHANVAAINYYFGDKEMLYTAVLEYCFKSAVKKYPPDLGLREDATVEERLHAFVLSFLYRVLDEGRPAWHGRLMAREIAEPTKALDHMVTTVVRPLHERLGKIVSEILGTVPSEQFVRRCVLSVIGQILFYYYCRPVLGRLYAEEFEQRGIDSLASHITQFSLKALKGMAGAGGVKD